MSRRCSMATPSPVPPKEISEGDSKNNENAIVALPPPPPSPEHGQYYVRFALRNETIGPMAELAVRNMIQERHLGITDMICEVGQNRWTVLSESKFGQAAIATTARSQFQSATCPNCQAHMATVVKSATGATILIWVGIFSSWAIVGLGLIVIGFIWRSKSRRGSYICPRCNYST